MGLLKTPGRLIHVRSVDGEALCAVAQHCPGGANGGDNACVSGERQSSRFAQLLENTTASAEERWPCRITNRELYH